MFLVPVLAVASALPTSNISVASTPSSGDLISLLLNNPGQAGIVIICGYITIMIIKWLFTNDFFKTIINKAVDVKKQKIDNDISRDMNMSDTVINSSLTFINETIESNKYFRDVMLREISNISVKLDLQDRYTTAIKNLLQNNTSRLETIEQTNKGTFLSRSQTKLIIELISKYMEYQLIDIIIGEKNKNNITIDNYQIYIQDVMSSVKYVFNDIYEVLSIFHTEFGRLDKILSDFLFDERLSDVFLTNTKELILSNDAGTSSIVIKNLVYDYTHKLLIGLE